MSRCYSDLILIPTFKERFEYLQLDGSVGADTFGYDRYLNQQFYRSKEWKRIRDIVIARDNGCDLGVDGYFIFGKVLIHHMNPIRPEDLANKKEYVLNPEFLITTCHETHNALHYSDINLIPTDPVERKPNDTIPWRK